jgi:hypothetical protein
MALKKVIQREPLSNWHEYVGWYDEAKAQVIATAKKNGGVTEKLVVSSENNLIFQRFKAKPVDTLEGKDSPERHIKVDAWDAAKFLAQNELDPAGLEIPAPHLLEINDTLKIMKK